MKIKYSWIFSFCLVALISVFNCASAKAMSCSGDLASGYTIDFTYGDSGELLRFNTFATTSNLDYREVHYSTSNSSMPDFANGTFINGATPGDCVFFLEDVGFGSELLCSIGGGAEKVVDGAFTKGKTTTVYLKVNPSGVTFVPSLNSSDARTYPLNTLIITTPDDGSSSVISGSSSLIDFVAYGKVGTLNYIKGSGDIDALRNHILNSYSATINDSPVTISNIDVSVSADSAKMLTGSGYYTFKVTGSVPFPVGSDSFNLGFDCYYCDSLTNVLNPSSRWIKDCNTISITNYVDANFDGKDDNTGSVIPTTTGTPGSTSTVNGTGSTATATVGDTNNTVQGSTATNGDIIVNNNIPSPSPTTGTGSTSGIGGTSDTSFLNFDGLGTIIKSIISLISNVMSSIGEVFKLVVQSISDVGIYSAQIGAIYGTMFSFLPSPIPQLINTAFVTLILLAIIKFLRN